MPFLRRNILGRANNAGAPNSVYYMYIYIYGGGRKGSQSYFKQVTQMVGEDNCCPLFRKDLLHLPAENAHHFGDLVIEPGPLLIFLFAGRHRF